MNKYKNIPQVIGGIKFDSKKEVGRFVELRQWLKEGKISNLQYQVKYVLQEAFTDSQGRKHREIAYIADFCYQKRDDSNLVYVEDVKGMRTDVYRIKKKLLLFKYKKIIFNEV